MHKIACCQLGFAPQGPKRVTLLSAPGEELPAEIPFFIQKIGDRLRRQSDEEDRGLPAIFRWPIGIGQGPWSPERVNHLSSTLYPPYQGTLRRVSDRWGLRWQGDFTNFEQEGVFQIETEYGFSTSFRVDGRIHHNIYKSFLHFLYCQRSGMDIPGVRSAQDADDARLDYNGAAWPAAGGWYDAGDNRKWLCFTLYNLEALEAVSRCGVHDFENAAREEIRWATATFTP
ncbi:MAG: hypothetical protein HC842_03005 [Cytophagales bacterium]|nr:hypothetical protein [Cytophagales bacterium]